MHTIPLNDKQREAVEHPGGPLLIAAGAGSGKTRTLTSRVEYLLQSGIRPDQIVAITFTNKAAQEMRARIAAPASLFIGTFHSLGARILKAEANHWGRTAGYTIFDDEDALSLLKKIMVKEMNLNKEQHPPLILQRVISKTKNALLEMPSGKVHQLVFTAYEDALRENNAFDFDDLIQKVVRVFLEQPTVLEKYQQQWRHVLVDEFQDVNTSQYEMVRLLAQQHQNLSVVGDDFQAIYGFRDADYRNFLNFERDWPNAKVVLLEENYRSTKTILQAANGIILHNKKQKPKNLWTKGLTGELVTVIAAPSENDEAEWVARTILQSPKTGIALTDIAVLYRTNAQSRAIEQNLIAARIPYHIFGGIRFYDRKEIKDIVAALRLAHNPNDSVSAERLLKAVPKKIAHQLIVDLPRLGNELSLLELIGYFLNEADYFSHLEKHQKNADERIENIQELLVFAGEFVQLRHPATIIANTPPVIPASAGTDPLYSRSGMDSRVRGNDNAPVILSGSEGSQQQDSSVTPQNDGGLFQNDKAILAAFLEQVALVSGGDKPRNTKQTLQGVNLMSIHLAKGLEFKTVFVIGCNEGILPHHRSYDEREGVEEERRLMYVAMTRAKERLFLSFTNLASRFLYEIPPALTNFVRLDQRPVHDLDSEENWIEYD